MTNEPKIPEGYFRIDHPFLIEDGDLYRMMDKWKPTNIPSGDKANGVFIYCRPIKGYQEAKQSRILPDDAQERKKLPIATGVLDYFPRTMAALARCSYEGNEQHNPGSPLHWDRSKSTDDEDAMIRHYIDRKNMDGGIPEVVKMAWRALAVCEKQLENQLEERP